jgi:hypothetical protein
MGIFARTRPRMSTKSDVIRNPVTSLTNRGFGNPGQGVLKPNAQSGCPSEARGTLTAVCVDTGDPKRHEPALKGKVVTR